MFLASFKNHQLPKKNECTNKGTEKNKKSTQLQQIEDSQGGYGPLAVS